MSETLKDFVSTYRPPIQPEPFFGFFEEKEDRRKPRKKKKPKRKIAETPEIDINYRKHYDHNVMSAKPRKNKKAA